MVLAPLLRVRPRLLRRLVAVIGGTGAAVEAAGQALRGRFLVHRPLDAPERAVTKHAIGDLQHARDLVERLAGEVKRSRW